MSGKRLIRILLTCTACSLAPAGVAAQVFTPTYMAPRAASDFGVYLADFDPGDLAVEGIARGHFGGFDLGFRAGVVDVNGANLTIGGEYRNPLLLGTAPLDLAVTGGVQGILGDVDRLGLQAGLSVGHTFVPSGGGLTFTPYLHPRIALIDDAGPNDRMDLEVLADVGFDLGFRTGLGIRFGVDLGGEGADWGVGLVWR